MDTNLMHAGFCNSTLLAISFLVMTAKSCRRKEIAWSLLGALCTYWTISDAAKFYHLM